MNFVSHLRLTNTHQHGIYFKTSRVLFCQIKILKTLTILAPMSPLTKTKRFEVAIKLNRLPLITITAHASLWLNKDWNRFCHLGTTVVGLKPVWRCFKVHLYVQCYWCLTIDEPIFTYTLPPSALVMKQQKTYVIDFEK